MEAGRSWRQQARAGLACADDLLVVEEVGYKISGLEEAVNRGQVEEVEVLVELKPEVHRDPPTDDSQRVYWVGDIVEVL